MSINRRIGDDLLLGEALRREDIIHIAASAIDGKASQVFAGSAILAVLPVSVLVLHPGHSILLLLSAACFLLIAGVVLAHFALAAQDYDTTGATEQWRNGVIEDAGTGASDEDVRDLMTWGLLVAATRRNEKNNKINNRRALLLAYSRGAMLLALGLTAATLATIAFKGHV